MKSLATEVHSILAPSGAHVWAECTASMQFIRELKSAGKLPIKDTNEFAEEGTAAHKVATKVLKGKDWFDHDYYETPDQEEFVPKYINYINDVTIANPGIKWHFEQRVNPAKYVKTDHCAGTADAIGISDEVLYVVDYKHGEYVSVDVEDNLQGILYGLGALAKLSKKGINVRRLRIVLVIVQPRAWHPDGPIREWETNYRELMRWAKWLAQRAEEALGPNPKFVADPEQQCRFCKAQGCCAALAEHELRIAREVFTVVDDPKAKLLDLNKLTHKELSEILRQLPGLKRWATKVSEYALSIMENGGEIPYWDLKDNLGFREWAADPEELELFFDDDILYERKLRSPAQVEKLAGKGSVDEFTKREVKGHTIVRSDDPHDSEEQLLFEKVERWLENPVVEKDSR